MSSVVWKHLKRGTSGTKGRRVRGSTGHLDLPPQPPWGAFSFPMLLHSKRRDFLLQNDDLIPEKLRAPDSLPGLLGLTGEPIHCHLHKWVNSRLAIMHLGLCWHHWMRKKEKVKDETEGSQLPPCGSWSHSCLLLLSKNKICFFLILRRLIF